MKTRLILPMTLLALAAVTPVASAAKTPKVTTKYTYKVELKGTQTSTWTLNHPGPGGCDPWQTGSGKETIRFSAKPATFYTYDGLSQPFFFTKKGGEAGAGELKLRGTVTRDGKLTTGPSDCPNGGGGTAIPRDCGTLKIAKIKVAPQYEFKKDRIILSQADAYNAPDFKNCPSSGSTWPYLLRTEENGKSIGQQLPVEDLFEQGKNIIIATGTYKYDQGELKYTNKIRWELSFTRIKKEKLTSD